MFPVTSDFQIAAGYAELARLLNWMEAFHDDPMSEYAPVEDFAEEFDRRERAVLARISRRAQEIGDTAALEFSVSALERWMP